MITGHNTDVEYGGVVYHVQTEDKGLEHPVIETLVYSRGEIIDARRSSYSELVRNGGEEKAIVRLMEQQHHRMLREVRNGRYDPAGPKPFGYNIISDRTLDEVVLEWLASDGGGRGLRIQLEGEPAFYDGSEARLGVTVLAGEHGEAAEGALVKIRFLDPRSKPVQLFEGRTDSNGTVEAGFSLPDLGGSRGALVVQARHGEFAGELTRPILPRRAEGA